MTKKKSVGHPAKTDPDVAKAFRAMKAMVELVRDLDGRISEEAHLDLRASALGAMVVYSELTGLPSPKEIVEGP